jgi:hypothetical protein
MADAGFLRAMLNVAIQLRDGKGVGPDKIEAYKWIELARFYTTTTPNQKLKWQIRAVYDPLNEELSEKQIKEGKQRAEDWSKNHRVHEPTSGRYY